MLASQATGLPSGNHGFFHRYHIEAITLEGCVKKSTSNTHSGYKLNVALSLLKTIEGISRSLNNLLESFHQSYFFYILVQNERFISIGDYMPCLILLIVPLYTEAFLFWMMAIGGLNATAIDMAASPAVDTNEENSSESNEMKQNSEMGKYINQNATPAILFMMSACVLSLFNRLYSVDNIHDTLFVLGFSVQQTVTLITILWNIVCISFPFAFKLTAKSLQWLHMICLLGLGTILVVLGVLNFALAYLIAIICLPLAMIISSNCIKKKHILNIITIFYTFILNPLVSICILIASFAWYEFSNEPLWILTKKIAVGIMEAITLCLVDNLVSCK